MIKHLSITVLADNRSEDGKLATEHGYSLWIEADDRRILFDAGQSPLFMDNAVALGIDPASADAVVISHGHFDHTGGLTRFFTVAPEIPVFCSRGAEVARYSRQPDGRMKMVGITSGVRRSFRAHEKYMTRISEVYMLTDDIGITGAIPRKTLYEDTGGQFYFDPEGVGIDRVEDDMAMWFTTSSGTVVVTGCGHSGIVNTVGYINKLTGNSTVHSVIGGFHLLHATEHRLDETCRFLRKSVTGRVIPCHCTGDQAVAFMQEHLPYPVEYGHVGKVFTIP